jgi:hypothetical protein
MADDPSTFKEAFDQSKFSRWSKDDKSLASKYRKMAQETLRAERSHIALKSYKRQIRDNLVGDALKLTVFGFGGYVLYKIFSGPVRRVERLETGTDRYPPPPPAMF